MRHGGHLFYDLPSEIWSRLALYSSRDVLARRYEQLHGRELNGGHARELNAHIVQAREYFDAAANAGALVKPLLQYYGVLALARAIVMFRGRGRREATLTPSHGLKADWPSDASVGQVKLTFTNGAFRELLTATKNAQEFSATYMPLADSSLLSSLPYSTPRTLVQHLSLPPSASECRLEDLVARMPHLTDLFEAALHRPSRCYGCSVTIWSPDSHTNISILRAPKHVSLDELKIRLGLPSDAECREDGNSGIRMTVTHNDLDSMFRRLPHFNSKGGALGSVIEPFIGGWHLSNLAAFFVSSFVLSTFVRYHPTKWALLAVGEKGDAFMPILSRLTNLIQTEFPALTLNELEREPTA